MEQISPVISAHVTMLGRNFTQHFPSVAEALGYLRAQEPANANAVTAMRIEVRLDKERKDAAETTWVDVFEEALPI